MYPHQEEQANDPVDFFRCHGFGNTFSGIILFSHYTRKILHVEVIAIHKPSFALTFARNLETGRHLPYFHIRRLVEVLLFKSNEC